MLNKLISKMSKIEKLITFIVALDNIPSWFIITTLSIVIFFLIFIVIVLSCIRPEKFKKLLDTGIESFLRLKTLRQ